ncbi:MAG: PTS lactose/cellobiose transporter subunit IIA [Candidatus Njordarchaeales archaeon]
MSEDGDNIVMETFSVEEIINKLVFHIIGHAGEARGKVFDAFDKIKEKDFESAEKLLEEAQEEIIKAEKYHMILVKKEAKDPGSLPFSLLLVHAEDLMIIAMSELDLMRKFLEFFKNEYKK